MKKKESILVLSSIPAGTPLKGINYFKNKTDPVAMEDSAYPSWLWDILKTKAKADEVGEAGDLYCTFRTR
jgi:large subunit ribosomal protein L54